MFFKISRGYKKLENHKKKLKKSSKICKAIIDNGVDVGFNLNEISYITDTRGWKEVEKLEENYALIKSNFTIQMKKRMKLFLSIHATNSLYQKDLNSNLILELTV